MNVEKLMPEAMFLLYFLFIFSMQYGNLSSFPNLGGRADITLK